MLKSIWKKAEKTDTALSLSSWGWRLLELLFPTVIAAVIAWAASYRDWIWNGYGLFGALAIGLAAALIASLAIFLTGLGIRASRRPRAEVAPLHAPQIANNAKPYINRTRHYSIADKDRIAEAFYELKEILTKQADPLQMEVQRIWQLWNQRIQQPGSGGPLLLEMTLERTTAVEGAASDLIDRLYDRFLKKYQSYSELLNEVLLPSRPAPIHRLREEAARLKHRLNDSATIYRDVPQRTDELARMIMVAVDVFASANTQLNGWIHDTLRRIDAQEKAILTS